MSKRTECCLPGFPELGWQATCPALECAPECTGVGISNRFRNLGDAQLRVQQEITGAFIPRFVPNLPIAGILAAQPAAERSFADIDQARKFALLGR
ncbi:hypothetical protein G6F57_010869 [Rhizopus arrhizus]|nr:hypothetical protein G6F63_015515 [Rhizopus arrhizus]KAG1387065.1 hypothetical protein G6F58_013714 [Rhizopus delemar]KAG1392344.1 hypothetical protein G6F59_014627 [Rhizopus arrhizus]KAG1472881.1 hypothetical protein G6F57_010869 [Rhizopus arrhizus]